MQLPFVRVLRHDPLWRGASGCRPTNGGYGAQGTFYGQQQAQDSYAACSLSENYANVNHLPWTTGISTTIALNGIQFADSAACGMCIMYRGVGLDIGMWLSRSTVPEDARKKAQRVSLSVRDNVAWLCGPVTPQRNLCKAGWSQCQQCKLFPSIHPNERSD